MEQSDHGGLLQQCNMIKLIYIGGNPFKILCIF